MNLHIFLDEKFVDPFVERLEGLSLGNNKYIVTTEEKVLKRVSRSIDFAPVGSRAFDNKVGKSSDYNKVFFHYLSVGAYSWILRNRFRSLNWMVWGSDLYQLPFVKNDVTLPLTKRFLQEYRLVNLEKQNSWTYQLKYKMITPFIYGKIDGIYTWMPPEFDFAIKNLPLYWNKPQHVFFRYPLNIQWDAISRAVGEMKFLRLEKPKVLIGNSGAYSNNHLDALKLIDRLDYRCTVPLSYGPRNYVDVLKTFLHGRTNVSVVTQFLSFNEYVEFINDHDAIVINTLRPQAVGNIWLSMVLGKPVFLNEENVLCNYLRSLGFDILNIEDLPDYPRIARDFDPFHNKKLLTEKFSDSKLDETYLRLFK